MPSTRTILKIFVSSPSNLNAERLIIRKVIEEVSRDFSDSKGIELDLFDWKKDAVSGIAADVQTVISDQLEYDVYIGLLGTVFGTPTSRYGSGTEEEFQDAYNRFIDNSRGLRVLFLFASSTSDIFSIDIEQLRKVAAFRNDLGNKGLLYHEFAGLDELAELARSQIRNLILKQWTGTDWTVPSALPLKKTSYLESKVLEPESSLLPESTERLGSLELEALAVRVGAELGTHFKRLTALSSTIASATQECAAAFELSQTSSQPEIGLSAANKLVDDLTDVAVRIQQEPLVFAGLSQQILVIFADTLALYFEDHTGNAQEIRSITDAFAELLPSLRSVRDTLQTFRGTIQRAPVLTANFRLARRQIFSTFDELVSSYTVFLGQADPLLKVAREKLRSDEEDHG